MFGTNLESIFAERSAEVVRLRAQDGFVSLDLIGTALDGAVGEVARGEEAERY